MSEKLPRILAIDDDTVWLSQIPLILEDECEVETYSTIDQGLAAVESRFYDIILLDLNFEGDTRSGLDVFRHIHAVDRGADVIVLSAETKPDRLIQMMNSGVTQFVSKPASPDEIRQAAKTVLRHREIRLRAFNAATTASGSSGENCLVGSSQAMRKLRAAVDRIVRDDIKDILLIGETGTGKEVLAKIIAQKADPSHRLIPIHCGAISDGIAESELFGHMKGAFTGADRDRVSAFETVGGGFIFFDEIGDMPLNQQAKLLRVMQERKVQRVGSLEERKVNFRTISATNVNLEASISEKKFREDLYYRIAKETLRIPPLRERLEDIPELVHYFLALTPEKRRKSINNEALQLLQSYSWPGNVRQLKTIVESLESRCADKMIREKDVCQVLPEVPRAMSSRFTKALIGKYGASLISGERQRFEKAIIQCNGDRNKAAEVLGLSRATFFRRAKELGLVHERRKAVGDK